MRRHNLFLRTLFAIEFEFDVPTADLFGEMSLPEQLLLSRCRLRFWMGTRQPQFRGRSHDDAASAESAVRRSTLVRQKDDWCHAARLSSS